MIMRCATEKKHTQTDFVIIFIYLFIHIISYGIQVHIIDNKYVYIIYMYNTNNNDIIMATLRESNS